MFQESFVLLIILSILFFVFSFLWRRYHKKGLLISGIVTLVFIMFTFYFFRDPNRLIPETPNCIVSPADGKIIEIKDHVFLNETNTHYTKIAIYLSLFDVHVQRIPFTGKVVYYDYKPGQFYPAFHSEASTKNEYAIIGIANQTDTLFVKQIAGILARRIICQIKENDNVKKGERYGMIKLGSRVELYVSEKIDIIVKKGDQVKGGESIIGIGQYETK